MSRMRIGIIVTVRLLAADTRVAAAAAYAPALGLGIVPVDLSAVGVRR